MHSPRVNKMIEAGRLHLQEHPDKDAGVYSVRQAMAAEVPDITAAEQMEALRVLWREFQERPFRISIPGGDQ